MPISTSEIFLAFVMCLPLSCFPVSSYSINHSASLLLCVNEPYNAPTCGRHSNYNVTFRRILKGADFAGSNAKLCFKKLLLQPRPGLVFTAGAGTGAGVGTDLAASSDLAPLTFSGGSSSSSGAAVGGRSGCRDPSLSTQDLSSLFQRWNLQVRQNYDLLREEALPTGTEVRVLLLERTRPLVSAAAGAASAPALVAAAVDQDSSATQPRISSRLFITECNRRVRSARHSRNKKQQQEQL